MPSVRIGSRTLAYDRQGAGRPVILLHAFPFDRRMWSDTAVALSKTYQVIAPDFRGFGESDLGAAPFSIAELADDVAALMDALALPKSVVGGLSMGGYVALAFAHAHPERLSGLMLFDTKAAPDTPEARRAREEAMNLVRRDGVPAYVDLQLPKLLSPQTPEPLRSRVRALALQPAKTVLAGIGALRDRLDRRPELPQIAAPTLILVGEDDVITPPGEAQSMASAIPAAALVRISGAGHLANLENPSAFVAAVERFVAKLPDV